MSVSGPLLMLPTYASQYIVPKAPASTCCPRERYSVSMSDQGGHMGIGGHSTTANHLFHDSCSITLSCIATRTGAKNFPKTIPALRKQWIFANLITSPPDLPRATFSFPSNLLGYSKRILVICLQHVASSTTSYLSAADTNEPCIAILTDFIFPSRFHARISQACPN